MIEMLMSLSCPRCASAVAARRLFWEGAPLDRLAVALVPFIVIALASWATARNTRDSGGKRGAP
jgi:hypothetical protein